MQERWDLSDASYVLWAMDRSHHHRPPAVDLRGLADLGWLAVELLGCLLACAAIGCLAALLLRHRGYGWSWGLPGAGLPVLVLGLALLAPLPGIAPLFAVTASTGLAFGLVGFSVYCEVEDHRSGGDRAVQAARRRGLLDTRRRRRAERPTSQQHILLDGLPIGRNARERLACIARGSASSGAHVLIPGATGAGKTTSLASLLVEYVVRSRFGAVVLEAKSDTALSDAAMRAAAVAGVPFRLVSPHGPSGYDPLAGGDVDERSERLLAAQVWGSGDAEFYRQASSPFLRVVLRALEQAGEPLTLAAVARRCAPDELENLALEVGSPRLAEEITLELGSLGADERRAIAGLHARLRNLASSEFAAKWLHPHPALHLVELGEAIRRGEVVYFRLDTDRTGNVGRAIGQMALLDLGAVASSLMGEGVGTFVAVDEYGALEAPALERLFARGRAAGFSVALGTQTLADLRAAGPSVSERVGATVSALLCHRLGSQADAEWVAQLIGTVPSWETTVRTGRLGLPTDEGTRTRGHRFEVNPTELQRLGQGEAVVARLDRPAARRASRVRVVPAWRRLPAAPSPQPL
jgi:hypothetical protein